MPKKIESVGMGLLLAGILLLAAGPAVAAEQAEMIYKTYCWQCHGM